MKIEIFSNMQNKFQNEQEEATLLKQNVVIYTTMSIMQHFVAAKVAKMR